MTVMIAKTECQISLVAYRMQNQQRFEELLAQIHATVDEWCATAGLAGGEVVPDSAAIQTANTIWEATTELKWLAYASRRSHNS